MIFFNKNSWFAPVMVLVAGLLAVFLSNSNPSVTSVNRLSGEDNQIRLARVDSIEMHKDFVCSCCGKNIAECTCGMAAKRRAAVDALAAKGLSKRGIYTT